MFADIKIELEEHKNKDGLQGLLEDIPCGAVIFEIRDGRFEVLTYNSEYMNMFSFSERARSSFGKQDLVPYLGEETVAVVSEYMERVLNLDDNVRLEFDLKRPDGSAMCIDFRCKALKLNEGEASLYCLFTDVTERQNTLREMRRKVITDQLTGLLNKAAGIEMIDQSLAASTGATTHALFVIDIDDFKGINDSYGHLFGDTIIQNIADKLRSSFRGSDIVARFGGDEFVVLMKNIDVLSALDKADETRALIHRYYGDDRGRVRVSCSVGMAVYPFDGTDFQTLFEHADSALYSVKSSGKGRVLRYSSDMGLRSTGHKEAENEFYDDMVFDSEDYDVEFVSYAMKLLSSTENLRSSIDILLERIGQKYDLGVVALFEKNRAGDALRATNYWVRDGISNEQSSLGNLEMSIEDGSDENGVLILQDANCPFSVVFQPVVEQLRIKSMLAFDFKGNALVPGKLLVCDCVKERKWSPFEIKTYYELSRVLAVFSTIRMERSLRLNALAVNAPEGVKHVEYSGRFAGKKVLIVEDNKINAEIAKTVVEYGSMTADIVENGREAIEMFLDKPAFYYDIILMDIEMPVMDGYEATRRIRNCGRSDAGQVPIIAMTHLTSDKDVLHEFRSGMSAHVSKPIDLDVLFSVIDRTLIQ